MIYFVPQTIVKTVVPEENIKKIEKLEAANRSLEREFATLNEKNRLEVKILKVFSNFETLLLWY